jgi:hypothetical protein
MSRTRQLTLETMPLVDDGRVALAFNRHVQRATQDIEDRSGNTSARVITITVTITPKPSDDNKGVRASTQIMVKSKVPDHRSESIDMDVRANGCLAFNEDFADNFDQEPLPLGRGE